MARIRSLRPSFWEDEIIGSLSIPARLLFIGCISTADDSGRLRAHPALLRSTLFMYDDKVSTGDVAGWLGELAGKGRIEVYEVAGQRYAHVVNFAKHQKIEKPTPSILPAPPESDAPTPPRTLAEHSPTPPRTLADSSPPDRSGVDRSGVDDSCPELVLIAPPSEPPVPLDALLVFPCSGKTKEWSLPRSKRDEWKEAFPGIDVDAEIRKALQWCRDNSTKRKTASGMPRFLSQWMSSAQNRGSSPRPPATSISSPRVAAEDRTVAATTTYRSEQQAKHEAAMRNGPERSPMPPELAAVIARIGGPQ